METKFCLIGFIGVTALYSINAGLPNVRHFSEELFNTIIEKQQINVFISPFSIRTALAMVYLGAKGAAAEELKAGLHLTCPNDQMLLRTLQRLIMRTKDDGSFTKIANRIYIDETFPVLPEYNRTVSKYLDAGIETLSYKKLEAMQISKTINKWISLKMGNLIKSIIKPHQITTGTQMQIISAIYFRGLWKHAFNESRTKARKFTTLESNKVLVDMMDQVNTFKTGYVPSLDAKAIELPYENSNISMLVILPSKKITDFAEFEKNLKKINLSKLSLILHDTKVRVLLPKFNFEFVISLRSYLKKLGIRGIFRSPNLSGITNSSMPLSVTDVRHKALIEVNEKGSTPASVTDITAVKGNQKKVFLINRPFVFIIKDAKTLYFIGHIVRFDA